MSKANDKKGRSNGKHYKWLGHIPVYFNDDELDAVIKYVDERDWDCEDVITRQTQAGIGVKFTYDVGSDCYHCTLQPKGKDCYLRGYTLGFNHVDFMRLMGVASYVCEVLIENGGVEIPTKTNVNSF